MNQSLFFLAYKGELMQVQVRIACIFLQIFYQK